jgi:hypothetical protein
MCWRIFALGSKPWYVCSAVVTTILVERACGSPIFVKVLGNLQVELAAKAGALRQMLLELLDHPEDIRKMTIMGRTCKMRRANGSIECSIPLDKQSAEGDKFYSHHLSTFFMIFCISTRMLPLSMSHRCCHVCR